jgi:hypothetical protein
VTDDFRPGADFRRTVDDRTRQLRRRRRILAATATAAIALAVTLPLALIPTGKATTVKTTNPGSTTTTTTTTTTIPATTTTGGPTTTVAPATTTVAPQNLPPIKGTGLPVPTGYTCPPGLVFLAPNPASGVCLSPKFLGSSTDSACPAGSFMTMGPVECDNDTGIMAYVPPGPNTCSNPGGPCPSGDLPLSPQASVIPWSAIVLPSGSCPEGYYFGEASGEATCVPYGYLPGGTASDPNDNTACPAGSGLTQKETGTLCVDDTSYDIVAPIRPTA